MSAALAAFAATTRRRCIRTIIWHNPFGDGIVLVSIEDSRINEIGKITRDFVYTTFQTVVLSVLFYIARKKLPNFTIELKTKTEMFHSLGRIPLVNFNWRLCSVKLGHVEDTSSGYREIGQ